MSPKRPIDRLLQYLIYKDISPSAAEKQLGIANGYIRNANLRESGDIGSNILDKIYKTFLDINLIWLISEVGEMLLTDENGTNTPASTGGIDSNIDNVITITPTGKAGAKTQMPPNDAPATAPAKVLLTPQFITVDREGNETIPYVPVRAAAGYLDGFGDSAYMETLPSFSLPGLTNGTYRAFEVDGDSMFPTLENKEIVVCQWVEKPDYIREDRVHIIVTKNRGIVVKRLLNRIEKYGYIVAKSDALDNRNLYPNLEIYPDEIEEIWYAVTHLNWKFKHPSDMYKRMNNMEAELTEVLRVLKEKQLLQ